MNHLPTTFNTQFTVKTNPDLGVLTIHRHMQSVSRAGEITLTHVAYVDKDGVERGCTPVGLFHDEWFELYTHP